MLDFSKIKFKKRQKQKHGFFVSNRLEAIIAANVASTNYRATAVNTTN